MIVLSTAYFPCLQHLSKFLLDDKTTYDYGEHFLKQSYRNRCKILGANGVQDLVIPVRKPNGNKTKVIEIEIDYSENWQKNHFKAIESAYQSSPFYEHYIDEFSFVFSKQYDKLIELNESIIKQLEQTLQFKLSFDTSSEYIEAVDQTKDFRVSISPKLRLQKPDVKFNPSPYHQVFGLRHGYVSNLSILDLLFNEGPNTENILTQQIKNETQA